MVSRHSRPRPHPRNVKASTLALAFGCALSGVSGTALLVPGAAMAAEAGVARRDYAIAPGKLSDVLAQFAATAGVPLSFDPQVLAGLESGGLQGSFSINEGFTKLLTGSGHALVEMGGGAYSLRALPAGTSATFQLDTLSVSAALYGAKETNSLGDSVTSVGVVMADDILDGNIRTFRFAFRRLSNIMDSAYADTGFVIRGINAEGFVPSGAAVASLYVDGVLQTRDATRRGARGLWDTEQVEVYRGPQSTFSGRAAMAGSIYIKSKDPTFEDEGKVSLTGGNDGLLNTAFVLNKPLSDEIALRMAGEFERSDSPVKYPNFQHFDRVDDLEASRYYNLRGKLLFTPAALPSTVALLSYSFAHDETVGKDIGSGPGFTLDDKRGDYNIPAYLELRPALVHNLGLEVKHEISNNLLFTSQTGLNRSLVKRRSVNEGTASEINTLRSNQKDLLATQELRVNYADEGFTWVGGVFASYEQYDTWLDRTLQSLRNDAQTFDTDTTNLALFGEAGWDFLPGYTLTLGGRVDYAKLETVYVNHRRQPLTGNPFISSQYDAKVSETNFVPKVALSRQFGEDQTAGVTFSQGFRAGNFSYNTSTSLVYEYEPEQADSWELFYKGRFLEDRLLVNANLFYTKYRDQQVEMRLNPADPIYREITNAASSRAWGFELEPTWQVTDNFSGFLSLGYLNSKFNEFNHYQYGDLSGAAFPEAPEWTVSLGGKYAFENGFHVGADAKYTSSYLVRFGTPPQERLGARTIFNLQAGYRTESWEVSAFVENLFDKKYFTTVDLGVAGLDYASLGERRLAGVNATLKF